MRKFLIFQFLGICALSMLSGYQGPDLSDANWETALFLTPSGIITNFLNQDSSVLWGFYQEISSGQGGLTAGAAVAMALVYLAMLVNFYGLAQWLRRSQ